MNPLLGLFSFHATQIGYAVVFGVAGLVCFASLFRAQGIDDGDIRRGLAGLLVFSGAWASAHVGRVLAPTPSLQVMFYLLGLVFGFGSVLAWLYFCSAYAGHSYHRTPAYRRAALVLFGIVILVKLTNPLHRWYFVTTFATTPFPHLVIRQLTLHWVVTGLAYALSAVGFYMLFEVFADIEYDTTALNFLVVLTGLPVVLDILGYVSSDIIIELNYEPIGVALFAVGVLYVTEETFLAVPRLGRHQLADQLDQVVLFLDADDRLLDANDTAHERFPGLGDHVGLPVREVVADLDDPVACDGSVIALPAGTDPQPGYWLVSVTPLTAGETLLGRSLVLTDVTDVEAQRRELQRQNDQLDGFAAALAHELRNTLSIVRGNLELIERELRVGETATLSERIGTMSETTDRMEEIVGEMTTLARLSKTVTDPPFRDFEPTVRDAWRQAGAVTGDLTLEVAGQGSFRAERQRTLELVRTVAGIARRREATTVRFALGDGELTVTMDGREFSVEKPGAVFEYGTAVPDARTGLLFANLQSFARAHGWTVDLSTEADGIRLRIGRVVTDVSS